jgi:hypothetical protein
MTKPTPDQEPAEPADPGARSAGDPSPAGRCGMGPTVVDQNTERTVFADLRLTYAEWTRPDRDAWLAEKFDNLHRSVRVYARDLWGE